MYAYTIDKMVQDIYRVAGRGVIDEQLNFIAFRVPFWKIEVVRQMLFCYMPVGVGYSIKRLSLIEHFSQWGVTFNNLYGQPGKYKSPNK